MTTALPFHPLLEPIQVLHRRIRDDVVRACEEAAVGTLSGVATEAEGDTIYAIDRVAEHELVAEIGRTIATQEEPVLLVAEGLPGGEVVVPEGADRKTARWVIIVDPIDGTRGVMYQKRPAWILTGVARGPGPCTLADIELAVQTEIPLVKQHLSDELWAVRGQGASAVRVNRLTGEIVPLILHPSTATTLAHGFAMISRFFPGSRAELAAIDDEVVAAVMGLPQPGKAQLFEDQYISSGGQLYELMAGHDRFVADLRPLFERRRAGRRRALLPPVRSLHGTDRARAGRSGDRRAGLAAPRATRRDIRRRLDRICERRSQGTRRATSSTRADPARTDRLTRPLRSPSAVPHGVPDLERFAADVAARLSAGAWPGSAVTHERRFGLRRPRARTAGRDGRHRRLLGRSRSSVADSRGHARRPPAVARTASLDHIGWTRRRRASL